MGNKEWRLVSAIIRTGDMDTPMRMGLNQHHFKGDQQAGVVYQRIYDHWTDTQTFRQMPLDEDLEADFHSLLTSSTDDDFRIGALTKSVMHTQMCKDVDSILATFGNFKTEFVNRPMECMQAMRVLLDENMNMNLPATGFSAQDILDEYVLVHEMAKLGKQYGIPYPWDCLTRDTLGKHPGDFILMYARAKQLKTWLLLFNAIEDFRSHGKRVLVWSQEMLEPKMKRRAASILAGIDYQAMKHGSLPPNLYSNGLRTLREVAKMINKFPKKGKFRTGGAGLLFMTGPTAPQSLEALSAVVDEYEPDVAYLDSYHKLTCARASGLKMDHEQQRAIAEEIKKHALKWEIPVLGTFHANTKGDHTYGEHMGDISRTDAVSREADLVLRVIKRGKQFKLDEEDYEGYWRSAAGRQAKKERKRAIADASQVKGMSGFSLPVQVGKDQQQTFSPVEFELPDRTATEIFVMISGNREGVLPGFSLKVAPGYINEVLRERIDPNEVKKIIRQDEEEANEGQPPKRGGKSSRKGRAQEEPVVGVGKGFGP